MRLRLRRLLGRIYSFIKEIITMAFYEGFVRRIRRTDPGFGVGIGGGRPDAGLPVSPGHPDAGLPPQHVRPENDLPIGPEHPWFGLPDIGLGHPDNELPAPPPGMWPPPSSNRPVVPSTPDVPPGAIWPPVQRPPHRWLTGDRLPGMDNTLPGGSGGSAGQLPNTKFWVVAGIPGVGWRYVCVDTSIRPDNEVPPAAQPK